MSNNERTRAPSARLRKSALGAALALCIVGGVQAQTNTAGAIAGRAEAGDTIMVANPDTGFSRTITAGSDGSYRFPQLPIGQYTVMRNGSGERKVTVSVGSAANVDFAAAQLDTITIQGAGAINPIDVSSVESTTILTAEQIAKLPVSRDTTSVALLAPGTVRGDAAFGNLASFGGASVAENQYYINGFNVTNSYKSLNFSQVPFEAIAETQVKTGGYGAEFGRSLGGVVNQITRRGTNDFQAGASVFWSPDDLRAEPQSVFLTNGTLRQDNSLDTQDSVVGNVWASGALVRDRLFAYGLVSYRQQESDTWGSIVSPINTTARTETPAWLLKLDWNITDNHLLEFTGFSDEQETETEVYRNTLGVLDRTVFLGTDFTEQGGKNYVLKYTGYLTDTFTLSALAGHGEFSRSQRLRTADGRDVSYGGNLDMPASGCPVIVDGRPAAVRNATGVYASTCNITGAAIDRADSGDTRDQFRIDAEWQLGDHRVRFGYDADNYESVAGSSIEGGRRWAYSHSNGPDRTPGTADDFDVATQRIINQGSSNAVDQTAFYLEDSWSITDNFVAYFGARWDTFDNKNGFGETFVKVDNQFGPRLGFSWDVFGDSSFKVYGNAGRYALPLTPSVAVRGASASLFTEEDFTFTGVDPITGEPTGLTAIPGRFRYVNGEFGSPKQSATIASQNLDPMYQDEYILGFQKALSERVTLGVRGIFRDLKAAIDDTCDYVPIMEAGGFPQDVDGQWVDGDGRAAVIPGSGFPYCRLFNPGKDAVFATDYFDDGTLRTVTVPGSRLSPQAKRTYSAIEFTFDGQWEKAGLYGSYTYAKSKGNTEGGVKSDNGQADTNTTQDFDYLALTTDTYGYLPNDRRHTVKLRGYYDITDAWSVGSSLVVQSGRPVNCFGVLDLDPGPGYLPHGYGSSFLRCGTTPAGGVDDATVVAYPRGTYGRLPWTSTLDLNVIYKASWAEGLQFKVDVFNALNSRKATSVIETAEVRATGAPSETFLAPASFQAPRSVRLMVQYDF